MAATQFAYHPRGHNIAASMVCSSLLLSHISCYSCVKSSNCYPFVVFCRSGFRFGLKDIRHLISYSCLYRPIVLAPVPVLDNAKVLSAVLGTVKRIKPEQDEVLNDLCS